ncbi:hypothetical protein N826_18990 [Skermanella aerolata KACC 11604]|nr:hypothetical protein N826_18990 [Skermanella aerolata KACC 11604]
MATARETDPASATTAMDGPAGELAEAVIGLDLTVTDVCSGAIKRPLADIVKEAGNASVTWP